MNLDSYIREIQSIDDALKRCTLHMKQLRTKKKIVNDRLYNYMANHGIDEYKGYKKSKLEPKQKKIRKKTQDKKKDAIELFRSVGINDPEGFWDSFQETQTKLPSEISLDFSFGDQNS